MILPVYNNERLIRQSSLFLLPGMFKVNQYSNELKESIVNKCKVSLRNEFNKEFFYIEGLKKEAILEELNILLNVREVNIIVYLFLFYL